MTFITETDQQTTNTESIPIVQTWNLSKTYRTGFWLNQKVESLKNCTLTVNQGETFGLLGPNGAGKTTLLKTLLSIIKPSAGRAVLMGRPLGDRTVKQKIGYLPENAYFYDYLTGWEFLEFTAGLFQIPKSIQKQRIIELLELVGLDLKAAQKKQLRQYSKGMVQRIGMAQALINDPEVVFLDEPMSGLDPMGRYQVREIILSLKAQRKTIFFNSHILSDVSLICDRIAILARGELLCIGSLDELLGTEDHYQVTVKIDDSEPLKNWLDDLYFQDNCWHGTLNKEPEKFMANLNGINGQLISINLARPSLEDFFIQQLQERGIYTSK